MNWHLFVVSFFAVVIVILSFFGFIGLFAFIEMKFPQLSAVMKLFFIAFAVASFITFVEWRFGP